MGSSWKSARQEARAALLAAVPPLDRALAANCIIAEELARRGWQESWLRPHPNFGPWTLDFGP